MGTRSADPCRQLIGVIIKIAIAYALVLAFSGLDWYRNGGDAAFSTLTLLTVGFAIGFLLKKFA